MTVGEALARINEVKENQYGEDTLVNWISDAEGKIYHEIIEWHEPTEADEPKRKRRYTLPQDAGTELRVPEPYSDIYVKYLAAQIDYHNGEIARYNNSMMMFNAELNELADAINRRRAPKQENSVYVF